MRPSKVLALIGFALAVAFPWLPGVDLALVTNANLAGEYALIAISLVVLTGWVGQISLAQGTFVGIGAFATGLLIREVGIPFPVNLPLVALAAAGVASLLGMVALRVRGLYLAVATLIFAWMADAYLFTKPWLVGRGGSSSIVGRVIGRPGSITAFDLSNKKVIYLIILATVVAVVYAASNLRDSKTGRAFFAIRGSEVAAVSLGIDVTRYKLLAFALSGGLAGIAGNLLMIDLRSASPVSFAFTESLFFLSVAVVGGITSLGGAVASAITFAGLEALFFKFDPPISLDVVAVGLLLVVLMAYPGGLGALGTQIAASSKRWESFATRLIGRVLPAPQADRHTRSRMDNRSHDPHGSKRRTGSRFGLRLPRRAAPVSRRLDFSGLTTSQDAQEMQQAISAPVYQDWRSYGTTGYPLPDRREDRAPILEAVGITVRFGGLVAVDNMNLQVREHEIVGLIGPNGAGKTTCFNAIAGLNDPAEGRIKLFGEDVTPLPVHRRAQMGVGRTFQLIQLFGQLSVFDNLLVATHVHNATGVFSHLAVTDRAVSEERQVREQVRTIVEVMGLQDVADRRVAGLPFGILRQIEIARALVTRAPFLMLDEPASGLDNAETEELTRLLHFIRTELGVTILLIEHDVKMVTGVSDYMYVINRGVPLAEGTPSEIQRNPEVIAAYLGEAHAEEVSA